MTDDTTNTTDATDATSATDAKPGTDAADSRAPEASGGLSDRVRESLKGVIDPELGLNIVDLGLVYDVDVEDGRAMITMTLTSPGCPAGGMIMSGAQEAAGSTEGVDEAEVKLVWKPFWTPERIDPEVRAALGF
ncbi:MAG: metal-sulfur cluster assembly factor [Gemmatimonadota bacterium]